MIYFPFSEVVDNARSALRKNKREFADAMGLDPKVIRNWEDGSGTKPHRDNLRKLARIAPVVSEKIDYLLQHYDDWVNGEEPKTAPIIQIRSGRYSCETQQDAHEDLDLLFARAETTVVDKVVRELTRLAGQYSDPNRPRSKRK